ncbi:carbohydrate-binding family 9-like protein [Flammeovirga sp. OC4]|uniref:carbohydrate-binding family 9-like protein n=1 Tax=Flammeovirga sp. OC4 TaxID=1382345 RepID=UPI0005C456CA|nr:carbohydrate-binding family 9-like protein [Flammeovirga sp. OC4]
MILRLISILSIITLFVATSTVAQKYPTPESYLCYQSTTPIKIDGVLDEEDWANAEWTQDFVDIEGDKQPNPPFQTRVKMLWDKDYLYIAAELEEPHLWSTITERDAVIYFDNDFEVFLNPVPTSSQYYEFEMNLLNTVWDLMMTKPYRDGGKFMNSWQIEGLKSAVKMYGTLNDPSDKDEKWTLEIAFPWNVIAQEHPLAIFPKEDTRWRINFSRVNWDLEAKEGEYTKKINPDTGRPYPEHNWVWSPQGEIAMHMPEQWGYLHFTESKVGEKISKEIKETEGERLHRHLYDIYYKQKKYFITNRVYAKTYEELGGVDKMYFEGEEVTPKMELTLTGFQLVLEVPQEKKIYVIREDSSTDIIEMN